MDVNANVSAFYGVSVSGSVVPPKLDDLTLFTGMTSFLCYLPQRLTCFRTEWIHGWHTDCERYRLGIVHST